MLFSGQLGLWVGISVITLAEVAALAYDIAAYLFGQCVNKTKPNDGQNNHSNLQRAAHSKSNKSENSSLRGYAPVDHISDDDMDRLSDNMRTNPIYTNRLNPRPTVTPIRGGPYRNTAVDTRNNQWAKKFANHDMMRPSIASLTDYSKEKCFSEV